MPRKKPNAKPPNEGASTNLRLPLDVLAQLMPKCHVKLTRCDSSVRKRDVQVRVKREVIVEDTPTFDHDYWNTGIHTGNVKHEPVDIKPSLANISTRRCFVKLDRLDCSTLKKHAPVKVELKRCTVLLIRQDLNALKQLSSKKETPPTRRSLPPRGPHQRTNTNNQPPATPTHTRKSEAPIIKLETPSQKTPTPCFLCGKLFGSSTGLQIHVSRHLGEKPHKCEDCSKSFVTKVELQVHRRLHTGERPYSCEFCDMSFAYFSSFKYHMRTRNGATCRGGSGTSWCNRRSIVLE